MPDEPNPPVEETPDSPPPPSRWAGINQTVDEIANQRRERNR